MMVADKMSNRPNRPTGLIRLPHLAHLSPKTKKNATPKSRIFLYLVRQPKLYNKS